MDARVRQALALLLAGWVAHASAGEGLRVDPDTLVWPRWQARLGVTTAPADLVSPGSTTMQGARVLGDYYFTGPAFGGGRIAGGFRATSGLFAGNRSAPFASPVLPAGNGGLTLETRSISSRFARDGADLALPYLGVGYTGLSVRGGWGFTADVGLVGTGVRFGRSNAGAQVDDLLRELRLTPMLQLGVSYSF
jgi:hypothetical protein